jgi:hypothetical protein
LDQNVLHLRSDSNENSEHFADKDNINNIATSSSNENVFNSNSSYNRHKQETPFPNSYHQKSNRALYEKSIADYLKYSTVSMYETNQQQQHPPLSNRTNKPNLEGNLLIPLKKAALYLRDVYLSRAKQQKICFQYKLG